MDMVVGMIITIIGGNQGETMSHAGEVECDLNTDSTSIDMRRYTTDDDRRGENEEGVRKTEMSRQAGGDDRAKQSRDDDVINDGGAPSSVEVVKDMSESYNNSMEEVMMMKSTRMMRGIEQFKDDPGDANGDCGRDDPIQSMNDDVEHGNKRVGGSIPMPSSDNNDMWNNKKDVSVSVCVSGSVSREQQKCKIMDGKCCNGCSVTFISVTSKEWVQNKKTRLFGWRSRKVTKPICSKNTGRANLSTTAKSESGESVI